MPVYYYIIAVAFVAYAIFYVAFVIRSRGKKKEHLEANPNDGLVYPAYAQKGLKSVSVRILKIDGVTHTKVFQDGLHTIYALSAGTHVIEATAETDRPGVMYKNVRTQYGPTKVEVEVEAKKRYALDFDVKTEQFTFIEKGEAK